MKRKPLHVCYEGVNKLFLYEHALVSVIITQGHYNMFSGGHLRRTVEWNRYTFFITLLACSLTHQEHSYLWTDSSLDHIMVGCGER